MLGAEFGWKDLVDMLHLTGFILNVFRISGSSKDARQQVQEMVDHCRHLGPFHLLKLLPIKSSCLSFCVYY